MGKQFLDLRRNADIVIETPEGLIRIRKPVSRTHKGKLEIDLPDKMRAFVGEERALDNARFLTLDSSNRLVPTYTVLVPVRGPEGSIAEVRPQTPVRLADTPAAGGPIRLAYGG
jgi:hypothetical protein